MKERNVITDKNPVGCDRLVKVTFGYTGFDGQSHSDGEIVVLDIVADNVRALFATLQQYRIPVGMAKAMEYFDGDDEKSMAANNTSAFNGRAMTGSKNWSKHAYGVAIDINPLQNPYISRRTVKGQVVEEQVLPAQSRNGFLQRTPVREGMAEEMLNVFYKHGFLIWGGNWKQPVDYQHFEIGSMKFIKELVAMPPEAGKEAFRQYVAGYRQCIATAVNRSAQQRAIILATCAKQNSK